MPGFSRKFRFNSKSVAASATQYTRCAIINNYQDICTWFVYKPTIVHSVRVLALWGVVEISKKKKKILKTLQRTHIVSDKRIPRYRGFRTLGIDPRAYEAIEMNNKYIYESISYDTWHHVYRAQCAMHIRYLLVLLSTRKI